MEKTPKISLKNLKWVRGQETGVVPFIYNNTSTAIKLYHEDFGFEILQLCDEKEMSKNQQALVACANHFGENFFHVSATTVFESSFSQIEQFIRFLLADSDLDKIQFSHKDIATMRKNYNKLLKKYDRLNARENENAKAKQYEQYKIMDF